jgi:DNA invertase Pin-like site-specific DNA recombinase
VEAFSYLRWSSDPQSKGDSLRRQLEATRAICAANKWTLVETLPVDAAISAFRGDNIQNGSLAGFRNAVEKGVIKTPCVLVVEAFDRLTRESLRVARNLFEELLVKDVQICTANNGKIYDKSSLDNPMEVMMSLFEMNAAHEYSKSLGRRSRAAWKRKKSEAINGVLLTRKLPAWIGIKTGSKETKDLFLIEERAEVVRRIFREYLLGKGSRTIAYTLTKERIKPFGKCEAWNVSSVFKILKSKTTIGVYQPEYHEGKTRRIPDGDPIEGYYPAAIDRDTFLRAQKRLLDKYTPRGPRKNLYNLFTGLLFCKCCGGKMLLKTGAVTKTRQTPYIRIVCARAFRGAGCKYKTVHYWMVEHSIVGFIGSEIQKILLPENQKKNALLEALSARIFHIDQKIKQIKESIEQSRDYSTPIPPQLIRLLNELNDERTNLTLETESIDIPSAEETSDVFSAKELKSDHEGRLKIQMALRLIIEKIEIDPQNYAGEVFFKSPPCSLQRLSFQWHPMDKKMYLVEGQRWMYAAYYSVIDFDSSCTSGLHPYAKLTNN